MIPFHGLRHTKATLQIAAGTDEKGLLQNTCNSLSKPSPTGKVAREARRMRGLTGQDGRIKHLSNRSVIQHPSSTTASRRSPFPVGEGFSILQQALSKPSPTGKVAREARRMRGLTGQDGRIKHLSNRSVIQHPSSTTASRRSPFPVGEGFSILQQALKNWWT